MSSDPNPFNRIAAAHADGAILFADTDGPDFVVALKFFEAQGRMIRVLGKQLICQPCASFDGRREPVVSPPEGRPDF